MDPNVILQHLDPNNDGKITEEDFVQIIDKAGMGSIGKYVIKHRPTF